MKFIIGIDEAGRGPLAGPVSVGFFGGEEKTGKWILKNIFDNKLRDSKKLSPKRREEIFEKLLILKKEEKVDFNVTHSTPKFIDKFGISRAIFSCITTGLKKLHHKNRNYNGAHCFLRLDGLLRAPTEYKNQRTIIKGDEKDVFIACASICAKVTRDALMCKLANKYPEYGFEIHKGYGTLSHRNLIKKFGLTEIHRNSFCRNIR